MRSRKLIDEARILIRTSFAPGVGRVSSLRTNPEGPEHSAILNALIDLS